MARKHRAGTHEVQLADGTVVYVQHDEQGNVTVGNGTGAPLAALSADDVKAVAKAMTTQPKAQHHEDQATPEEGGPVTDTPPSNVRPES
jgi:hypothetical protein